MNTHHIKGWDTKLHELADGVFAYTQATGAFCIANAGFVAGDGEGVAIDALFAPRMTEAFQKAIGRVSRVKVRRLINTHHHVDHTLGNFLFPKATIIAQEQAREVIIRTGFPKETLLAMAPWFKKDLKGKIKVRPPDVTFKDKLTLYTGGRRLDLTHVGPAHTVGDTLVHLAADRVLFAGDVCFFYVTPLAFEGNIAGWIRALQAIEDMDNVETIVPGHGPLGTKEQVREVRTYFEIITREAHRRFEAGMTEDAAARDIAIGEYARWGEAERLLPNVYRLFAQFRGDPNGPIDVVRAFAGMANLAIRQ
ncbi:MAG: MBL fold metallo-hydrolase [Thermoflexaceae bacterium]|nr:MBL fold metallo-hydrolase [Thermoflexaceae bacterium]